MRSSAAYSKPARAAGARRRPHDQQEGRGPHPAGRSARVKVLGINALYHDPAAALVVDGKVVAAAEEERFSRRKHGKRPLPWSAWELPELSAAWVLAEAGVTPAPPGGGARGGGAAPRRPRRGRLLLRPEADAEPGGDRAARRGRRHAEDVRRA